jgi:serine/threonine-protein kinase HipA
MAMAVLGKNRHFHWDRILPRHFVTTAQRVEYSKENVAVMMTEMKEKTEQVIADVEAIIPANFPVKISDAIFAGLRHQAARLP